MNVHQLSSENRIKTVFEKIAISNPKLTSLRLSTPNKEGVDAHMDGRIVIISASFQALSEKQLTYLISHEIGHFLSFHHVFLKSMAALSAAIVLIAPGLVVAKFFGHNISSYPDPRLFFLGFLPIFIYLLIKEKTLFFEYQADKKGAALVGKAAFVEGMKEMSHYRLNNAATESEKKSLRSRLDKKLKSLGYQNT